MNRRHLSRPAVAVAAAAVVATGSLLLLAPAVAPVPGIVAVAVASVRHRHGRRQGHHQRPGGGLHANELARLADAEVALAESVNTQAAARQLAKHAVALLDAPAALVLIERLGDTVRVVAGDVPESAVYAEGSRARLLEEAGVPCGSIVVAPRSDGRPFDDRDERILDALAQRVSSTLHRLSLFEAVGRERQALADVLASSSDGIFSTGPDRRIRSWNPAMERLTGTTETDAVGQPCCVVFRPWGEDGEKRHGSACPGRITTLGADPVDVMLRIDVDHAVLWLNAAFAATPDGGYVCVARDVTARKQIDDEKADFLATVSHELRTPLTPLKGFLQTLHRRGDEFTDEQRHHLYAVMLREQERLERLVEQLLQATSLDQLERLVVRDDVDLSATVAHLVEMARAQHPERVIDADLGAEAIVSTDRQLADQVVSNLVSNALKYSEPTDPVLVTLTTTGDEVVISVADRGPGVASADRDRIFEKFTRLGSHLTRPQQGVGLGLYIARRTAEALGGRLWVTNRPGGGSLFSFAVPLPIDWPDSPATAGAAPAEVPVTTPRS
jgi:PAS domain S-box-containing protein